MSIKLPIRLVIAEDHYHTQLGLLSELKQPQFEIVGVTSKGKEVLTLCQNLKPDVLILDISLEDDISGFTVIQNIRQQQIPVKIIAISANEGFEQSAITFGADLSQNKQFQGVSLTEMIYKVVTLTTRNPTSTTRQNNQVRPGLTEILTSRQIKILELLDLGYSSKQIALQLNISSKTVDNHVNEMYERLGITNRSRVALTKFAKNYHLLKDTDHF